jgi:hypothetical protein
MDTGVTQLSNIMRRNVGRHANGNTTDDPLAKDLEPRSTTGSVSAIVIPHGNNSVLVNLSNTFGDGCHPRFGITPAKGLSRR